MPSIFSGLDPISSSSGGSLDHEELNKLKTEVNDKIEALKSTQSLAYEGTVVTCENTLASRTSDMIIKGNTYQNLDAGVIESAGQKENKISILSNNNKLANDIDYKECKKEISLPIEGGLKLLPNGVYDTIEQRNNGVYLVQRVKKMPLDGSVSFNYPQEQNSANTVLIYLTNTHDAIPNTNSVLCNAVKSFNTVKDIWNTSFDEEGVVLNYKADLLMRINKSRLDTVDYNGIKKFVTDNQLTVYYPLKTPIETKLDINNLDLEVYKDITYVTTDNAIQPTLSFKVPSSIGGVIQENAQNINKLYKLSDEDVEISSVAQMKLNDTIFPLANNETVQLEVTKNFEGAVIYETSDSAVATVSTSGLITKKANGKATITAKCKDKSVSCEVVDLITKNSEALSLLNIPYLHSRGITGKGVKVAIIESLIGNNEEFEIDGWYDPISKKLYRTKPSESDIDGTVNGTNHTYHMSTLIHGKTRGVAPDCEFYNILAVDDVYDSNHPENYDWEKYYKCVCDGVEWAIEFGIKVINMSLYINGGYARFLEVFKKAYDAGVTICLALGNCDKTQDEYSYYNGYVANGYCLMIGACEKNGDHRLDTCKGEAMMFNNYGFTGLPCWNPSGGYNVSTGKTSAATALTTGCVALLLQQDPTLTPRQIFHILKDNAKLHSSCTPGVKSIDYGWGRINVPVLSNITYKTDSECKALDSQIPIEDINAVLVKGRSEESNGFYKNININYDHDLSCYVIPVEQDKYTYELIPLNDNARLFKTTESQYGVRGIKPGIFRMLIRLKELGISKEVSFNVKYYE